MSVIRVAILGAGGFAREVLWALREARAHDGGARFEPVAFVERVRRAEGLKGLPVIALEDVPRGTLLLCGIGGMTEIKEKVTRDAELRGFAFAPAAIAAGAHIGPDVSIGDGTIVCAGSIVTCDVEIGRHVAINLDCTVGHDARIGDRSTLSPGVHVSGKVTLGRGTYLGTNSSVLEGLTLGDHSILGAGAVATRDIPAQALAVGVPATIKKHPRDFVIALPAFDRAAEPLSSPIRR
jgi:sugar O-acyltransferase (sialic acid O-acetyltransferase NeuD family)